MRQKKRKMTEKETRHQRRHDSLHREQSLLIMFAFFASDLMHNSTGYVIKQLVHAFSCALSSYGARGKFGEHSRSLRFFGTLQTSHVLHNSIVHAKA